MKYLFSITVLIAVTVSCKDHALHHGQPAVPADSAIKPVAKKDFSSIHFAVKKDLSCGMPLTAGLEDTTLYNGKYYGFCSPECKADFIQHAAAYTKKAGQ